MIHLPDIDYMGDGEGKQKKIMREYCVLHHYDHWCLLKNAFGIRRGVTNAELMQMGFLNQKILAEIPHAFVREPADTRVYFKIGKINLPKKFDKVRVDCAQIKIYILDFGWYVASDPIGTWEIKK